MKKKFNLLLFSTIILYLCLTFSTFLKLEAQYLQPYYNSFFLQNFQYNLPTSLIYPGNNVSIPINSFNSYNQNIPYTPWTNLSQNSLWGFAFPNLNQTQNQQSFNLNPLGQNLYQTNSSFYLPYNSSSQGLTLQNSSAYPTFASSLGPFSQGGSIAPYSTQPYLTFNSLSYPISCPRPETKRRASRYFLGCRGGGQTFNTDIIDLNFIKAYFLEKNGRYNPNIVKEIIYQNCQNQGWLIFATHDISETPTLYGCTPSFFEEIVRFSLDSGARILPVAKALDAIRIAFEIELGGMAFYSKAAKETDDLRAISPDGTSALRAGLLGHCHPACSRMSSLRTISTATPSPASRWRTRSPVISPGAGFTSRHRLSAASSRSG